MLNEQLKLLADKRYAILFTRTGAEDKLGRAAAWKEYKIAKESTIQALKLEITTWAENREIEKPYTQISDFEVFYEKEKLNNKLVNGIKVTGQISLYNSFGSIGTRVRWMNKVTIVCPNYNAKWVVRAQKAQTDPHFLHPLAEDFCAFITKVLTYNER